MTLPLILDANGALLSRGLPYILSAKVGFELGAEDELRAHFEASRAHCEMWRWEVGYEYMITEKEDQSFEHTMAYLPLKENREVPENEIWLVGRDGIILGKISNLGVRNV
jgi:hypothetical protein